MTQSIALVGMVLVLMACLPIVIKRVKQYGRKGVFHAGVQAKFVSAVAVGPHQSVVTVEAGPEGARVWLTLGVTAHSINCLHVSPVKIATDDCGSVPEVRPVVQD
jgi:flagellar protein FliO/FliZ